MITRQALHELASFRSAEHEALSFYFQPFTPHDQSHREEAILIKDLVKNVQRTVEHNGRKAPREALARIVELADRLNGNHSRAKAIFACESSGLWREFDLPPCLLKTALVMNQRFHLRPLARLLSEPRCCVVLVDRKRARIFNVWLGDLRPVDDFVDMIPRGSGSDGFAGYDAGHVDRHVENHVMRHFDNVGERLLRHYANGSGFDRLLVGCRDELWREVESHLHPYLREALLGRCGLDPATASLEDVAQAAAASVENELRNRRAGLLREVIGEARRNGRGALGLRHVLTSLERGEVQTVLLGDRFDATITECVNCGHLDTRVVRECSVCGQKTREIEDAADALIGQALRNRADLLYVTDDELFAQSGGVGALLRFRADQNTEMKKVAS